MASYNLKIDLGFALDPRHGVNSLNPANDTPVTFDHEGAPRDRFGDEIWVVRDRRGRPLRMNFKSLAAHGGGRLGKHNIVRLKCLLVQQMYASTTASIETLRGHWHVLRNFAAYWTKLQIKLDELARYDRLLREWATTVPGQSLYIVAGICSGTHTNQNQLGFNVLSGSQISYLQKLAGDDRTSHQTAYIPARLHDAVIEECRRIVDLFLKIFGEVESCHADISTNLLKPHNRRTRNCDIVARYGDLSAELVRINRGSVSPADLIRYFNDVRQAAFILVANYTLARKTELLSLRSGCYKQIRDPHLGRISMIQAETTKTQSNRQALWISTPRAEAPIEALVRITTLVHDASKVQLEKRFHLFSQLPSLFTGHGAVESEFPSYSLALFNPNQSPMFLRAAQFVVTPEDFGEAHAITPTLNQSRVITGELWPFSLHQFRRTMIVRCAASGIVSPQTLSFQAKHQTEAMTWHYLSNYWKLIRMPEHDSNPLRDTDAAIAEDFSIEHAEQHNGSIEYIRRSNTFFTPHGEKLKQRMLDTIPLLSIAEIKRGEKVGVLKQTTLGACTYSGQCDFSTAKSVKGCMTKSDGGVCTNALISADHTKEIEEAIESARDERALLNDNPKTAFKCEILDADIEFGLNALSLIRSSQQEGSNVQR